MMVWVPDGSKPVMGFADIEVGVKAAIKPDGIALDVPAYVRVVITPEVVREIRLPVEMLPREPQREVERSEPGRVVVRHIVPEWFSLVPPPNRRACGVCDHPRRVQVIRMTEVSRPECIYQMQKSLNARFIHFRKIFTGEAPNRSRRKLWVFWHTFLGKQCEEKLPQSSDV